MYLCLSEEKYLCLSEEKTLREILCVPLYLVCLFVLKEILWASLLLLEKRTRVSVCDIVQCYNVMVL